MINKEQILKTAQRVVRQQKLPVKIRAVEEMPEAVAVYFVATKKVPLKNLARDLEFELNLPIKLERVPKETLGKIGKTDVLGDLGCCATFSSRCLFKDKHGCGYGFGDTVSAYQSVKVSKKEPAPEKTGEAPEKQPKKKRRKMIRRLVIK